MHKLMKILPILLRIVVALSTASVALLMYIIKSRKEAVYPEKHIEELFKKSPFAKMGKETIVVITGSTGGIGQGLAGELYSLGLTVIIASRNEKKCLQTIEELKKKYPGSKGGLDYGILDVCDLDSVQRFVKWFKSKYTYLNFLINNAGQHYAQGEGPRLFGGVFSALSPQGYDDIFAINYLGHFLLTYHLLPMIKQGRVVSVTSSYHYLSDGSTLRIVDGQRPDAANGENRNFFHRRRAYAVTKLAQILHMVEVQRRLEKEGRSPDVITAFTCPGWTQTSMLPHGSIGAVIRKFAFNLRAGLQSTMNVLFDGNLKGAEFCGNCILPIVHRSYGMLFINTVTAMGARENVFDLFAFMLVLLQSGSYGINVQASSPESRDPKLAGDLYEWTVRELKSKGYISDE